MKAKMLQVQAFEKQTPLPRGLEGKFEGGLFAADNFCAKRFDHGGHRNGISFFAPAFGRGKINRAHGHVDLSRGKSRLAQSTSGRHGNRPAALHPQRLVDQCGLDPALLLDGNLGFLGGVLFPQLKPIQSIFVGHFSRYGLAHDRLQKLDLGDGRIPTDRLAGTRARVFHTPFKVVLTVFVTEGLGMPNLSEGQKSGQVSPAKFVALQGFSSGRSAQPLRNPDPSIGELERLALGLKVASLGDEDLGLLGVGRVVVPQSGVLTAPHALNAGAQLPKGGACAAIKRGHGESVAKLCSKLQPARPHFSV